MIPLHDDTGRHLTPWVTRAAVAICVAVFLYQLTLSDTAESIFYYQFGLTPASFFGHAELPDEIARINPWATLVTTIFVHGGFMHLLGNMLFLWTFGDNVEDCMGHGRYIAFFLATGAVAALTHALADTESLSPLIGASGAVAGILGAYLLMYPKARILVAIPLGPLFLPLRLRAWLLIGIWFGLQVFNIIGAGVGEGGVAWLAHIGGFVAGLILLPILKHKDRKLFSGETAMAITEKAKPSALKILRPEPHPDAPGKPSPWKRGPWG